MVKEESSEERFGENVGQLMDPNDAASGQTTGQVLHGSSGGMSPQVQGQNQQLPKSDEVDIKSEINPLRTAGPVKVLQLARTSPKLEGGDSSMSNSYRGNEQVLKNQSGRKRNHTDRTGILTSPSNQLADIDRSVEDRSLVGKVESFLSHVDGDQRDAVGRCMDVSKGFTFNEVYSVRASTGKVICCDFSSDGKLLASAGHDKKAILWYTDTMKPKTILEEHTAMIADVRFSPSLPRLATSSLDKTVRVWDVDNKGYSLHTFMGHSSMVTSLDFHPNKDDLICSCDNDGEIRYWSINNGSCTRVYECSSTQLRFQPRVRKYLEASAAQIRFQPRVGKYLAASSENVLSVLDVETQACLHSLQGHSTPINSVCWDPSGDFLASVSKDMVKVWTLGTGSEGECVHELSCNGSNFMSCVFHPAYPSLLVIGCYQSIELWNMSENKTMTLPAHDALIASLAVSTATGLIASASHDKLVKLWK